MKQNKLGKWALIVSAVAVISLGIAAILFFTKGIYRFEEGAGSARQIIQEESFESAGIQAIALNTTSADVRIRDSQSHRLLVRFSGWVRTADSEGVPQLVAEQRGSTLEIGVQWNEGISLGFGAFIQTRDLVVELSLPADYDRELAVKTTSGDVKLNPHSYSTLALRTTSGNIELAGIEVTLLNVNTTSGDFTARELFTGKGRLGSTSGNITATAYEGDAEAETTSGNITLKYLSFANTADIHSTSGDVYLQLPPETQFRLRAVSTSGDITCDFPIEIPGSIGGYGKHTLEGMVNNGNRPIRIKTTSGDIRILD